MVKSARASAQVFIDAEKDELYDTLRRLPAGCWLARAIERELHELERL